VRRAEAFPFSAAGIAAAILILATVPAWRFAYAQKNETTFQQLWKTILMRWYLANREMARVAQR